MKSHHAAKCNAVHQLLSIKSTSAFFDTTSCAISRSPREDAIIKAVDPVKSLMSVFAPACTQQNATHNTQNSAALVKHSSKNSSVLCLRLTNWSRCPDCPQRMRSEEASCQSLRRRCPRPPCTLIVNLTPTDSYKHKMKNNEK